MTKERSSLFLMANLGAEVSRVFSLADKGLYAQAEEARARAKRIIVELRELPEMQTREPEIVALERILEDLMRGESGVTPKNIKSYFMPFAERMLASM